jgi:hypothetical protein
VEALGEERRENHHRTQSSRAVRKESPTGSNRWPVLRRMRDGYWAPIPGPNPGAGEAGTLEEDGLEAGVHCMGLGRMLGDRRRRGNGHIQLGEGARKDRRKVERTT